MDLKIEAPASHPTEELKTGLPDGVLACHLFKVSFAASVDQEYAVSPNKMAVGPLYQEVVIQGRKQMQRVMTPQHTFIPCVKSQCNLWSKERGGCLDKLVREAQLNDIASVKKHREATEKFFETVEKLALAASK